jgi:hypothetical protein
MRSPARLVTGTAAAALTAAALGLATPSAAYAYPDSLGRPGFTAAPAVPDPGDCGPEGAAGVGAAVPCDGGETAAGDLGAVDDLEAEGLADDLEPLDGTDPLEGLEAGEDPAAASGPSWPDEGTGTGTEEYGAGTGDESGTLRPPGAGTGTDPGTEPETRPGPGTGPGSAQPPVHPGHRPTATPSPSRPSGHVGTGVGGSAAPDTAQLAAGAGLVAAAAVSGVLLLRRRRSTGALYRVHR